MSDGDQRRLWIGTDPDDMRRVRPRIQETRHLIRRADRRAEVVCHGSVIAVVGPRTLPLNRMVVWWAGGHAELGQDWTLRVCSCDRRHHVDGALLLAEVERRRRSGRPAVIGVADVERQP